MARSFAVNPTVIGEPAGGLRLALIEVTPAVISVNGRLDAMSQLQSIPTEPVNLRGIKGEAERHVRVRLPDRVTADGGQTVVVRLVVVASPADRTFTGIPVRIEGVPVGATASADPTAVTLRVVGGHEAIDRVVPDDIAVLANVSPRHDGTTPVSLEVPLPRGVYVAGVSPHDVTLQIKLVKPQTPLEVRWLGSSARTAFGASPTTT